MMNRLGPRPWMTAPATRAVIAALQVAGGPAAARFVGGCVRDTLLERDGPDMDIDVATPLAPTAVVKALTAAGLRAVPTGIAHGTITAVAQGRPVEITTLRRDVVTDGRHAVVAFTLDWAEDAARRDFRLNALYADPDGTLHDPTGYGIDDAVAGRVVFVGDPSTRIREDYLRILRFFRFFAHYGQGPADAAALAACGALRDGLAGLSAERVSKELLKLLTAPDPRPAVRLMAETGVLATLLPEAGPLARFEGLVDLGTDGADPVLRLAALLAGPVGEAVARRLRLPNRVRDRLAAACASDPDIVPGMTEGSVRRAVWRSGSETVADRMRLAWAVNPSDAWRDPLALAERWTPPTFPVTGDDVVAAGAALGPEVGRILKAVQDGWLAEDFQPDRAVLLTRLDALMASIGASGRDPA
jgi:poly(A) polymerase